MTLRANSVLQSCCSSVAALSLSLYKHVFSCSANPGSRVCVWGGARHYLCIRALSLSFSLQQRRLHSLSLSLCLSLSHFLSHSLSFSRALSLSVCPSVCLSLAPSLSLSLNTQVTTYILSKTYVALTCQSAQATSIRGLKLLVYEALSY